MRIQINPTGRSSTVREVPDQVYTINALPKPLEISLTYDDMEHTPAGNVPFLVTFSNKEKWKGILDAQGKATLYGVPQISSDIEFGDSAKAKKAKKNIEADYLALDIALDAVTKEQVNKAITSTNPELTAEISQETFEQLELIVNEQLAELKNQGEAFDDLNFFEQSLLSLKALAEGAEDGIIGYIPDLGEFGTLLEKADISIFTLMEALASGDIDILERKLKLLSEADRAVMHLQQASATMEALLLLISDPVSQKYLVSLPRRFLEAMPPDQHVQWLASLAVQKGIDIGIVAGGTAIATVASAPAAGSAGPLTAVLLSNSAIARSSGKALEQILKTTEGLTKNQKLIKNNHKNKDTKLDRGKCPICNQLGEECTNRRPLKNERDGKFLTTNTDRRHTKHIENAITNYPMEHKWGCGQTGLLAIHHVIPIEAVKKDFRFEKAFSKFDFDINTIDNLVVLPMNVYLACELRVQLHNTSHEQGVAFRENITVLNNLKSLENNINKKIYAINRLEKEIKINENRILTFKEANNHSKLKDEKLYKKNNITNLKLAEKDFKSSKDKLNLFSESIVQNKTKKKSMGSHRELVYHLAAKSLAFEVLSLIKDGNFCLSNSAKNLFANAMKKRSEKILEFINDFTWTLRWDARDYHPNSQCGCSMKKTNIVKKEPTKKIKKKNRTKPCGFNRDHAFGLGEFKEKLKLGE